ncbi:MAG: Altered inheritance of mitochondria protein 18 mitochondrial [Stictis urceolatum]|nr:Altered inheritance of mitochondria protein 18 mitochondrial [Stictis urceolata]
MSHPLATSLRTFRLSPNRLIQSSHLTQLTHHRLFHATPKAFGLSRTYLNANLNQLASFREQAKNKEPTLEELKRGRNYAAIGLVLSVAGTFALIFLTGLEPYTSKPDKSDSGSTTFPSDAPVSPEDEKTRSLRATGTSSVPFFPKTITVPRSQPASTATPALPAGTSLPGVPTANANDEFSLLGLGIRTVSFLSIQVYVVGLYVATSDLPLLQRAMIRAGADVESASTLVANEKKALKERLLEAERGMEVWDKVLREAGVRSVVRVVPTRSTDYAHLRDGWVRGIMARSGNAGTGYAGERFDDEGFGEAVGEFKKIFGTKKLAKGRVLLLERERGGKLVGWEQSGGEQEFVKMGEVHDERVGRLVWMGYLAGKQVSSEGARKDVVDGVLDLVERPIGTVETQVV